MGSNGRIKQANVVELLGELVEQAARACSTSNSRRMIGFVMFKAVRKDWVRAVRPDISNKLEFFLFAQ